MSRSYIKYIGILSLISLGLFSCKKESSDQSEGDTIIKVSLSGTEFEDSGNIGSKAKVGGQLSTMTGLGIQQMTIPLKNDLIVVAELIPGILGVKGSAIAAVGNKRAATDRTDLPSGVKYKVVVYNNSGSYVTERDYIRTEEDNTEALQLNGGETYTFVAYSVNSKTELPDITFSDSNNKTLSTSSLSNISGTADVMYFRKEMTVTGGEVNNLNIVLKHKFSEITTIVDASATGYNIGSIDAGIDSHYPTAEIQLLDGSITRSGVTGVEKISFSGLNSMQLSGAPLVLNGNTDTGALVISSITIGSISASNLTPFNDLSIVPGVRYTLRLTITPNDMLLTHQSQSAVRINGLIWMRHNLGANTNLDPDVDPTSSNLGGNYYQFGRTTVVATPSTQAGAISNWNTTSAAANAWNSGSVNAPVKTGNDPCPSGFRVPTSLEFQQLIDNTTASNIGGTWGADETNRPYGPAKVLTSVRNKNVQLTFPAAGYRSGDNGTLYWRGGAGGYWVSNAVTGASEMYKYAVTGPPANNMNQIYDNGDTFHNRRTGYSIRCIAEH